MCVFFFVSKNIDLRILMFVNMKQTKYNLSSFKLMLQCIWHRHFWQVLKASEILLVQSHKFISMGSIHAHTQREPHDKPSSDTLKNLNINDEQSFWHFICHLEIISLINKDVMSPLTVFQCYPHAKHADINFIVKVSAEIFKQRWSYKMPKHLV